MKKIAVVLALLLTGCVPKWEPQCQAIAYVGGKDTTVEIYGTRMWGKQVQYRAGYPFNWQWVSVNNFKYTNCELR